MTFQFSGDNEYDPSLPPKNPRVLLKPVLPGGNKWFPGGGRGNTGIR
jgi:hypothetical protein